MAKFNNIILIMVALFLASGVIGSLAQETEKISPASVLDEDTAFPPAEGNEIDDPEMPPEPSPGYYKYLEECSKKVTPECGKEIFLGMFENGPVTKDCCNQLLEMGKPCHDSLVNAILRIPEYKPKASATLEKSVQIWDLCVLVAEEIAPSQIS